MYNPAFRADGALVSCGFLEDLQAVGCLCRPLKRVVIPLNIAHMLPTNKKDRHKIPDLEYHYSIFGNLIIIKPTLKSILIRLIIYFIFFSMIISSILWGNHGLLTNDKWFDIDANNFNYYFVFIITIFLMIYFSIKLIFGYRLFIDLINRTFQFNFRKSIKFSDIKCLLLETQIEDNNLIPYSNKIYFVLNSNKKYKIAQSSDFNKISQIVNIISLKTDLEIISNLSYIDKNLNERSV
jgi:hypothetical protein